jgi:RNA polymerase sigma-70 factor (ECF subfamily)
MQEVSKNLSLLWSADQGWAEAKCEEAAMQETDYEQGLLGLIQQQPEQGLAEAIKQYGGLVQAVVRRVLGNECQQDVEECTSEVFWRLYQAVGQEGRFEAGRSLKSYLCGIARHVALDRGRRLSRTVWQELPPEDKAGAPGADPAEQLADKDQKQLVQQCVDAMPQPDRDIFILRYYFGEQVKSIAARLGLETKAVENRLYQGRRRLKKTLMERGVEL